MRLREEQEAGHRGQTDRFVGGCPRALSILRNVLLCAGILIGLGRAASPAEQPRKDVPPAQNPAPSTNAPPQQMSAASPIAEDYRIRPGDLLHVLVFQEADLTQQVKVSQQGTVNYPLLGSVQVSGLTVLETEKKMTELLGRDYLVNPRVTITVGIYNKGRRVSVLGQVRSPGVYDFPEEESLTLLQLIARAGGFTNIAAKDRVSVIRTDNGKEQTIRVNVTAIMKSSDKSKDFELKPGDTVSVPETFF